jgi:hypothetical protein
MTVPLTFDDIVVIGGGCYGSFYTGQLQRARAKGRVRFRQLTVVDRDPDCRVAAEHGQEVHVVVADWAAYLDGFFEQAGDGDVIVPSPLMPHLFFDWITRRARAREPGRVVEVRPLPPIGTPYETVAPDETRYVSYADWLCPTHCIEPLTCPVTRGPRTWDMAEGVRAAAPGQASAVVVFECRHVVFGVGAVPARQVLAGDRQVVEAGRHGSADLVVGTVSGCHGAVNLLHLGPHP